MQQIIYLRHEAYVYFFLIFLIFKQINDCEHWENENSEWKKWLEVEQTRPHL